MEARACDAVDLPFQDDTFDMVVANHMLYHVPDPRLAASSFARVLRPGGILLAATNGPTHLRALADLSREALGWSSLDTLDARFGRSTGEAILRTAFGSVTWRPHPSTMVCTDPSDVIAYLASTPAGQDASPGQNEALREAVESRFSAEGGVMTVTTEAGCFVAN